MTKPGNDGSDRPTLVVNADDLGLTESATAGILRAHRDGVVTSASLAVTTPAAEKAAEELPEHPRLGVGLHFCLTAGRPVADPADVPDLARDDGFMRWRFGSLLAALAARGRAALLSQISIELEAQIVRAKSFGVALDHVNGERHIHLLPGVFELVEQAARRHGIPHVRLINDVGSRFVTGSGRLRAVFDGGWAKLFVLQKLTRRAGRVGRLDGPQHVHYATLLRTGRMLEVLPSIWSDPPSGVTEVAVHPGLPEIENSPTGNDALAHYLASPDRRRATEACLALDIADTPARLATFAEVYENGGPRPVAEGRSGSRSARP